MGAAREALSRSRDFASSRAGRVDTALYAQLARFNPDERGGVRALSLSPFGRDDRFFITSTDILLV